MSRWNATRPKTRQATVSRAAQEVTNLHQHQCASVSLLILVLELVFMPVLV